MPGSAAPSYSLRPSGSDGSVYRAAVFELAILHLATTTSVWVHREYWDFCAISTAAGAVYHCGVALRRNVSAVLKRDTSRRAISASSTAASLIKRPGPGGLNDGLIFETLIKSHRPRAPRDADFHGIRRATTTGRELSPISRSMRRRTSDFGCLWHIDGRPTNTRPEIQYAMNR